MNHRQLVPARMGTRDGLGWCLRFTQSAFGAPVRFNSAREAWDGQQGRHPGQLPPAGVQSIIWFDHVGTYGTPRVKKNWGHVAVALGDGRVLTSPMLSSQLGGDGLGQAIYPSIDAMMRALGNASYLGYSTHINGLPVIEAITVTPTPGQEEDEDMARYIGSYIGGDKNTPAEKRSCVIYEPTSGFYTTWSGVNQAYTNDQARVFGTGNFSHITQRHWDETIRPQLDQIRKA